MTILKYPQNNSFQTIHTVRQKAFYAQKRVGDISADFDWAHLQQTGEDYTMPQSVCFAWDTDAEESVFELSETDDFTFSCVIKTNEKKTAVQNLKADQTYFWRVNGCKSFAFTTDGAPRWICADGLVNIRDNGGWKTTDGKRIRQGLIYRGSEMEWQSYHDRDPSKEHHLQITEEGIRVMREELGIKTDLDLRLSASGYLEESPLGKLVDIKVIPLLPYYHLWEDHQETAIKQIFELLADPQAYPIYYHCWGGSDRTGTVAFLLEAFLGVSEEDMILDYELSSLACWGKRVRSSDYFKRFEQALFDYDQAGTWQERSEKYLLSCGVSRQTLQALRKNLLSED